MEQLKRVEPSKLLKADMREPIYKAENAFALRHGLRGKPADLERTRDAALLWRATTLAIESAFSHGQDLPVGAVAAHRDAIVGRSYASDKRHRYAQMHAEYMAVMDAMANSRNFGPDTLAVTLEPCDNCQDFIATQPTIRRVVFGLTRRDAADRGLVKSHDETIFQRALRVGLPYQVMQVDDEALQLAGGVILEHTQRHVASGAVQIDKTGLQAALTRLNAE